MLEEVVDNIVGKVPYSLPIPNCASGSKNCWPQTTWPFFFFFLLDLKEHAKVPGHAKMEVIG